MKHHTKTPWGENPDWPVCDWQYDVASNDTRLGYWEWVEHNKESEEGGANENP